MSLSKVLGTYKKENKWYFAVASLLFLLYAIYNLIDMSQYIRNLNITEPSDINKTKFVYIYMAGYFIFIMRLLIALITVFVLILIIRIAISAVINMFGLSQGEGQEGGKGKQIGGASDIMFGAASGASNVVAEAVFANMRGILSFVICPIFILIFLIVIPLFLLFFLIAYVQFYNPSEVASKGDKAARIMLTHHHFLMFTISSIFVICFAYSCYYWAIVTFAKGGDPAIE